MPRTSSLFVGLFLVAFLAVACNYRTSTPGYQTLTPGPNYKLRDIITLDVATCPAGTTSGQSTVSAHTFVVTGLVGDQCVFDMIDQPGTGYSRWACRVPTSLGTVSVQEFDKGVTDIRGYRYGEQWSFDMGSLCTLAGCGEGVIYPADCPRGP